MLEAWPFSFEDRGFHELKGVPGRWPLFALGAGERSDANLTARA